MAAETVPPTSDNSDEMAGRGARRWGNVAPRRRGHYRQPNVKCGVAILQWPLTKDAAENRSPSPHEAQEWAQDVLTPSYNPLRVSAISRFPL
jgi:hypothetical protein